MTLNQFHSQPINLSQGLIMTFPSYTISEPSTRKHAKNLFEMVKNVIEITQAAFFMLGFLNTPIGYNASCGYKKSKKPMIFESNLSSRVFMNH